MDNASGSVVVAGICRSNNRSKLTLPFFFCVCVSTVQEQRTLLEGYEKNKKKKKGERKKQKQAWHLVGQRKRGTEAQDRKQESVLRSRRKKQLAVSLLFTGQQQRKQSSHSSAKCLKREEFRKKKKKPRKARSYALMYIIQGGSTLFVRK